MLDMTFQLLFFLVLTLKPHAGEERMFEARGDPNGTKPPPPSASEPPGNAVEDVTLVVRARPDGSGGISALTLQSVEGQWVATDLVSLQRLLEERRPDSPKGGRVRLKPDSRLKYAFVMDVLDVCKRSGFPQMSFATPDS